MDGIGVGQTKGLEKLLRAYFKTTLPKMSKFSLIREGDLPCPVRALKIYIKMTKLMRAGSDKLFICIKKTSTIKLLKIQYTNELYK